MGEGRGEVSRELCLDAVHGKGSGIGKKVKQCVLLVVGQFMLQVRVIDRAVVCPHSKQQQARNQSVRPPLRVKSGS
jgi:hypothetical protein